MKMWNFAKEIIDHWSASKSETHTSSYYKTICLNRRGLIITRNNFIKYLFRYLSLNTTTYNN